MKRKVFLWLLPVVFISYIGLGFALNFRNFRNAAVSVAADFSQEIDLSDVTAQYESQINSDFYEHLRQVDVNGLFQKIMGKKIVNRTVLGDHGKLYNLEHVDLGYDQEAVDRSLDYTKAVMDAAKSYGATALYVQHPQKYNGDEDSLPYGKNYAFWDMDNYYVRMLGEEGYNVLDLRRFDDDCMFFKTDHHWQIRAAFNGSRHIIEKLTELTGLENVSEAIDISYYKTIDYKDSYLGSVGVRVGSLYMGMDDFELIIPDFETNYEYFRYGLEHELAEHKTGTFESTLIDYDLLDADGYMNKYNAYDRDGYIENIIINNSAANDQKVLLISDSFSRPLQAFLSVNFQEIRTLDPQEGRYNHSLIRYSEEYQPDIVIIMYDYGFTNETMEEDGY